MSAIATPKASKSSNAKISKVFDAPFEAFNIAMPNVEMPEAFRDLAEKTVSGGKEAFAKMKAAAEDATEALEDSVETTRAGVLALSHQSLDTARANTEAAFAHARALLSVKSFAEFLELQTSFARTQFETMTGQAKDFQALSQKIAAESARPMKDSVEKAMKSLKIH